MHWEYLINSKIHHSSLVHWGKLEMRLIFDGHLDLALFALAHNRDQTESVAQINAREVGMTDALERGGATVSLPYRRERSAKSSQLQGTDG